MVKLPIVALVTVLAIASLWLVAFFLGKTTTKAQIEIKLPGGIRIRFQNTTERFLLCLVLSLGLVISAIFLCAHYGLS